jgi:DNA-binding MarR family transcriptional regulator
MKHYTVENFTMKRSLGYKVTKLRNLVGGEMDAALKSFDISSQQMGILLAMRSGEVSTPFELSKMLSVDTGLMTRMLDKLEARELLKRSRSLEDRRVVNLSLTKKGEQVAAQLPGIAIGVLNARLSHLSKTEFDEFGRLLDKIIGE